MTIRPVSGLLAVLACAGCATNHRADTANSAAEQAFLAKYASPAYSTASRDHSDQEVVCSRDPRTGSHLRTPRCFTRLDLDRMTQQSRRVTQRALKN